jgi:hypothetical protein
MDEEMEAPLDDLEAIEYEADDEQLGDAQSGSRAGPPTSSSFSSAS